MRRHFIFIDYQLFSIIKVKIASEGERHKPSSDREKYIAESELVHY